MQGLDGTIEHRQIPTMKGTMHTLAPCCPLHDILLVCGVAQLDTAKAGDNEDP